MNANDTRNEALRILREVFTSGAFIQDAVTSAALSEKGATDLDRRFIYNLVRGTTERKTTLEAVLTKRSSTPLNKLKPLIRLIMLQGLYELLYTNGKAYGIVNEYVTLTRRRGLQGLSGFVNAVLRHASADKDAILDSLTEEDAAALPEELLSIVSASYGRKNALAFGRYVLTEEAKQLMVRRNISRCTEEAFLESLRNDGAEAFGLYAEGLPKDEIYVLKTKLPVRELSAFRNGLFYVQDISAWSAFRSLNAVLGGKKAVLDLCAAPGGKSFQLMDLAEKGGFQTRFTACDISENRLHKLTENADRMGFSEIRTIQSDATVFHPSFEQAFDLVLSDVPCSGIGDLAGKPEIRLHVTKESVEELSAIQKKILENAARYVKPGGILQYSTCTLCRTENEGQIISFLKSHEEYQRLEEKTLIPGVSTPGDGFYYARMKRNA